MGFLEINTVDSEFQGGLIYRTGALALDVQREQAGQIPGGSSNESPLEHEMD